MQSLQGVPVKAFPRPPLVMQRQPHKRQNGLVDLVPINLHGLSILRSDWGGNRAVTKEAPPEEEIEADSPVEEHVVAEIEGADA